MHIYGLSSSVLCIRMVPVWFRLMTECTCREIVYAIRLHSRIQQSKCIHVIRSRDIESYRIDMYSCKRLDS